MENERKRLNQLNIHSLRIVARELGVKSPTALKKHELINEILLIQSEKKQVDVKPKKGRPPKKGIQNLNDSLDFTIYKTTKDIKKELIASILKEIEKKLYKLL